MFGDNTVKETKYLRLIVRLQASENQETIERLVTQQESQDVLGVSIPCVTLLMAPGRNLAILVEVAVRNHLLKLKGRRTEDVTELALRSRARDILRQQKGEEEYTRFLRQLRDESFVDIRDDSLKNES